MHIFFIVFLSIASLLQATENPSVTMYVSVDDNNHHDVQSALFFRKSESPINASLTPCQNKMLEYAHQKTYGKGIDEVWSKGGLYDTRSYETVLHNIVCDEKLSSEQRNNLWNGYCHKRIVGKKEKLAYGAKLNKINAQKSRSKSERLIAYEQEKHEVTTIFADYSIDLNQKNVRKLALEKTEEQAHHQYVQTYTLKPLTMTFLQHQGLEAIEYTMCYGTELQQQFHKELCKTLDDAALLYMQKQYPKNTVQSSLCFLEAAHEANEQELLALTATLSYISQTLMNIASEITFRYIPAAVEGVIEAGHDAANMILNPQKFVTESLQGIGSALWYGLETASYSSYSFEDEEKSSFVYQDYVRRKQEIKKIFVALKKTAQSMSGPDLVKILSKQCADAFIFGKCIKGLQICTEQTARVAKYAKATSKEYFAQQVSLAADKAVGQTIVHELTEIHRPKRNMIRIAPTPHKNHAIATSMKSMIQSVQSFETIVTELKPLIKKIQQLGGCIPQHNIEFITEIHDVLKKLEQSIQLKTINTLMKQYGRKIIDNKQVNAALNHILSFECTLKYNKHLSGHKIHIEGGHLYGMCELLEQTGIVSIIDKKILPSNAIDYTLKYVTDGTTIVKTICPMSWDAKKIIEVMWHVYEYGKDVITKNGNWFKVKKVEGIDISLPLTGKIQPFGSKNLNTVRIQSLLPYAVEKEILL